MIHITDDVVLRDEDIQERFVRATGAGGKNRVHDATAVELRVDLAKLALPDDVIARLVDSAGKHVTKDGVLVVVARADESQARNREAARGQLLALLSGAAEGTSPRRATRPRRGVRKARRQAKQQHRALKRGRRAPGE